MWFSRPGSALKFPLLRNTISPPISSPTLSLFRHSLSPSFADHQRRPSAKLSTTKEFFYDDNFCFIISDAWWWAAWEREQIYSILAKWHGNVKIFLWSSLNRIKRIFRPFLCQNFSSSPFSSLWVIPSVPSSYIQVMKILLLKSSMWKLKNCSWKISNPAHPNT